MKNIKIHCYNHEKDFDRVITFLQETFLADRQNHNWMPQRWVDMEYRINVLHMERKLKDWKNFIRIWEDNNRIVGILNSEGGCEAYMNVRFGYEKLYPEMLGIAEDIMSTALCHLNGKRELTVWALESLPYMADELKRCGYRIIDEPNYKNHQFLNKIFKPILPQDFSIAYGDEITDENRKACACELGFNQEKENIKNFIPSRSFVSRDSAPTADSRFETMVIAPNGEIASILYCFVDKVTNSAVIEPVCTRLPYRRKGLGRAMLVGCCKRLKENGFKIVFVDSYGDQRKAFYNSAGFITHDIEHIWYKEWNA